MTNSEVNFNYVKYDLIEVKQITLYLIFFVTKLIKNTFQFILVSKNYNFINLFLNYTSKWTPPTPPTQQHAHSFSSSLLKM